MLVTSTAFENGKEIPKKYTCDGENVNPPISIAGIPPNAQSLAIILDDPDAPTGVWNHWIVWGIGGGVKVINENSVPMGASLGTNNFGKLDYKGPCPPGGTHRYFFRVYALDIKPALLKGSKRVDLEAAMRGHILTQAELMGTYTR